MTSPQAPAIQLKEGVIIVQDLLCALVLALGLARSYNNHHVAQDDRKPSAAPKHGYSPKHGYLYSSKSDDGGNIHRPDKSDTVFAIFLALKAKKKRTQK
jgi:hypothetical protein